MLTPRNLLIATLALAVALFVACGGTSEETATMAAPTEPLEPTTPVATVVATSTPKPTNTPSTAQDIETVAGRLRIATIPPSSNWLVRGWVLQLPPTCK